MGNREVIFRKSSRSLHNGNCVEVADGGVESVLMRDSKNQDGGVLAFSTQAWRDFIAGVKADEFDVE